jgi:hypothetical protein
MPTYLENIEHWKHKGEQDARDGKPCKPPNPHYLEVIEAYERGYASQTFAETVVGKRKYCSEN